MKDKRLREKVMSDIIIREMVEEDIDEVLAIEKKSFSTPWTKEAFVMEITKNTLAKYIVAEREGKIVGYGGIWLIVDEGHVTNIAVDPDFRGYGIGNYLVEGLIDICKKRDILAMTLEVRVSNNVARNLYNKYGFIDNGIRPKYYSDTGEDAIIMWKEL